MLVYIVFKSILFITSGPDSPQTYNYIHIIAMAMIVELKFVRNLFLSSVIHSCVSS